MAKLLETASRTEKRYATSSRFPEAVRDIALVVNGDVSSESIEAIILRHKMVQRAIVFDVFTGGDIPRGKKSVGYKIVFQSSKDTLTIEQVNKALEEDILRQLKHKLGAELRAWTIAPPDKPMDLSKLQ